MMKKMVLTGIRQMALVQAPLPQIDSEESVRIRMGAVGVCGSDVHYFVDGKIGSQVVSYPFAVGHEGAGVVESVGSAVSHLKVGDRVAVEPAMPCLSCDQCRAGRPHTCRKLRFLGCPAQAEGCLAEYIVMPQHCCFPIPPSMSLEEATLSEPLAIGLYAVKQAGSVAGAKIGILGAGPIGLSVLLHSRARGAGAVYMSDKIPSRLHLARTMGADWAGSVDTQDVVAEVCSREPQQLDIVFECCGQQEALDQALGLLKPGGTLMIVGIPRQPRVSFSIDALRHKELTLRNVRRQNGCVQETLDMMASGAVDARSMITHRFSLEQTPQAFALAESYGDGVVKAMINFGIE
jgi:L-iditol 2-dehydrogenase